MKKIAFIIVGFVAGIIIFGLVASIVAMIITTLANTSWNPSSGTTIFIGLVSEVLKYGLGIYGGYKVYKFCVKKYNKTEQINKIV